MHENICDAITSPFSFLGAPYCYTVLYSVIYNENGLRQRFVFGIK